MNSKNKNTLYCFSPAVMVATLVIEIALAVYVFVRTKTSAIKKIAIATLLLLALFQLAEYMVCGAYDEVLVNVASRVGYVAITFLPALGMHLANEIAGRKNNWTTIVAYLLAGGFALYFGFAPATINSSICTGNYVIFNLKHSVSLLYTVYYFSVIFSVIGLSAQLARIQKNVNKRKALHWLIAGIMVFLVPTGLAYWLIPDVELGIPSIMCGFAVLYAIILAGKIVPLATKPKRA
ncbi:MAG: hypothetical protein E6Q36_01035 [Chryseobacterium sp.]|nr:MAG: hypothetical protein E6Q36_01035 [Chryseobacterium sp.]